MQVVARVEVIDQISHGKLTTEYRYHHGYWDGTEREFRGFGMVEQLDTETFADYHATGAHGPETHSSRYPKSTSPRRCSPRPGSTRGRWMTRPETGRNWIGPRTTGRAIPRHSSHTDAINAFLQTLADPRHRRPEGWVEAGRERLERIRPIAERHGLTPLQLACVWNLAHHAVECVAPTLIQEPGPDAKPIERKREELAAVPAGPVLTDEEVVEIRDDRRQPRLDAAEGRDARPRGRRAPRPLGGGRREGRAGRRAGASSLGALQQVRAAL